MAFQRTVEDFTCQHCGTHVHGNGFTNHCPMCLWSMHVDVSPGDRAAQCGGMMKPLRLEGGSPDYRIIHRCQICGFERPNAVGNSDDTQAVVELARKR